MRSATELADWELVEAIKGGDDESLNILIRKYLPKVYNRVHSLVPEADVEDVTQDIFLSLADSIHSRTSHSSSARPVPMPEKTSRSDLIEFLRQNRREIEILMDQKALFTLAFIQKVESNTMQNLIQKLGWGRDEVIAICANLQDAGMITSTATLQERNDTITHVKLLPAGSDLLKLFYGKKLVDHSSHAPTSFETWFHRIVMNKVADYHRKTSRRKEQLTEKQPPRAVNPWNAANDGLIVKEILVELPEKYREVLSLKFSEGLSFTEIAEKLDLSYEATRSRYRRAVEAFRDEMERSQK
ncbi:sigma-70 family RNA polymerase sigma factor [Candidatus Poribacteria bacterium]